MARRKVQRMGSNRKGARRALGLLGALLAALAVSPAVGAATEAPTRDEYVARLELVCKPDAEATQRVMKGARSEVQTERLGPAAAKFGKAASIFGGTIDQIEKAPRPSADVAKLDKWFGYLRAQESYLDRITAQLKADRPTKAQRLISRFIHNGNLANTVVLAFGFDYCSFKFSRYG